MSNIKQILIERDEINLIINRDIKACIDHNLEYMVAVLDPKDFKLKKDGLYCSIDMDLLPEGVFFPSIGYQVKSDQSKILIQLGICSNPNSDLSIPSFNTRE